MLAVLFGSSESEKYLFELIEAGRAGGIRIYGKLVHPPAYPRASPGGPTIHLPTRRHPKNARDRASGNLRWARATLVGDDLEEGGTPRS